MAIITFLIIILALVLVHEFGHFLFAKLSGMRVDEFAFGFPPKLFGKKIGETIYSINSLPLGGYVKILGENPTEVVEEKDTNRSFNAKPWYLQALVLVGGVFFNFLFAWFLFSVGFLFGLPASQNDIDSGYTPNNPKTIVMSVLPQSPAEKAGIKKGETILAIAAKDGEIKNPTPDELTSFVNAHENESIIIFHKTGDSAQFNMTPVIPVAGLTPERKIIGISLERVGILQLPLIPAITHGLAVTLSFTEEIKDSLFGLIHDAFFGKAKVDSLMGPVGIVSVVDDTQKLGFSYLIVFTAVISINLAIVNLLPLPALDGGRLVIVLGEALTRRKLPIKIMNYLNMGGFALLSILIVFITYHDIIRLLHR